MTMPRTSVVIPTFNRSRDVVRAARSVLAQTMPAFEILIVDDGSIDDTARVVADLPPPVRYLHKDNGGVSSARNLGIRHASGEFIAFLDSDDYWEPNLIEQVTRMLDAAPDLGSVSAGVMFEYPDGRPAGVNDLSREAINGRLSLAVMLRRRIGCNLFVRRDVLARVGNFDESLSTGEDIDMVLRVLAVAGLGWVSEPLIHMTRTPGSLSGRIDTGNRMRVFDKFERLHPELALRHSAAFKSIRAATALSYARDLTVARRLSEARNRAKQAWRHEPSSTIALQWLKIRLLQLLGRSRA